MIEIISLFLALSFPVTYSILFPWWRSAMGRMMFLLPLFVVAYVVSEWEVFLLLIGISFAGQTYCVHKTWRNNPK